MLNAAVTGSKTNFVPGTRLPFGTTVGIVTALCGAELIRAAKALQRRGHPVIIIIVGAASPAASTDGLTIRRVNVAPALVNGNANAHPGWRSGQ